MLLGGLIIMATAMAKGQMSGKQNQATTITDALIAEQRNGAKKTLRVAIYPGVEFAGGLISNNGLESGRKSVYSETYDLTVIFTFIEDFPEVARRLIEDEIDIAWATPELLVCCYHELKSINPVAFLQYCWSQGKHLLIAQREISSLEKLRSTRLACARGSAQFFAYYLLHHAGINISDVKWKITSTESDAALLYEKGSVDACVICTHQLDDLTKKNIDHRVLISTEDATHLISGIFIARETTISLSGYLLERFARGWFDGVQFTKENPDEAISLLSKHLDSDTQSIARHLQRMHLADYNDNCDYFALSGDSLIGFNYIFETFAILGKREESSCIPSAHFLRDSIILANIEKQIESRRSPDWPSIPGTASEYQYVTARLSIPFKRDSAVLPFDSFLQLKDIARQATVFESSQIHLSGSADPDAESGTSYLIQLREDAVMQFLHKTYSIPFSRFKIIRTSTVAGRGISDNKKRIDIRIAIPRGEG
jgi:hypothetical protein